MALQSIAEMDIFQARIYLMMALKQEEFFTDIERDPEKAAFWKKQADQVKARIRELLPEEGEAGGNSDAGAEGQEG